MEQALPFALKVDREKACDDLNLLLREYEGSALVAKINGAIVGVATLSAGSNAETITVNGCLEMSNRQHGIGHALVTHVLGTIDRYAHVDTICINTLRSFPGGLRFLTNSGFLENDELHWSERSVHAPFNQWAQPKRYAV